MLLATWLAAPALLVGALSAASAAPPASAAPANPACAQAGPCVIVQVLQGEQVVDTRTFYADEITGDADVIDASYPVSGGGAPVTVNRGSSVARLVSLVVDPGQVTFTEVVGTDLYGRHLLTAQELGPAGANGFEDDLVPAFYATESTVFNYIRPQRSPDEQNGAAGPDLGAFFSDPHGSILVRAHTTGAIIDVGVTATPTDATQRSFALGSDPTGAGYTFDWHLPDQSTSTQPTPTYSFPPDSLAGTYPVSVGVDRADDGSFGWGQTTLSVGPKPSQPPSPSPTPPGSGGDGPGNNGPTHHPSATATGEPNPDPDGGTDAPTLPPVPTELPTSTSAPTSAPTRPEPTPTESTEPSPTASGAQVTGILLAAAGEPVGGEVVSDVPPPSAAARPLADPAVRISSAVWFAAGVLVLLLAGAASESARLRRWLRARWSKMAP